MIQVLFIYKFINNMMYTKFITIFYTLASKLVFGVVFCAYKVAGGQPNHFEPLFFPSSHSQFLYVSKEDHMDCNAFFGGVKFCTPCDSLSNCIGTESSREGKIITQSGSVLPKQKELFMTGDLDLLEIRKVIEGMPSKERTFDCMKILNSKKYATSLDVVGVREPEAGDSFDFVLNPESNFFILMAGDLQVQHIKKTQAANIFYSTRRVFGTSPHYKHVPALWRRNVYSLYAKDLKAFLDTSSRIECPSAFRLIGSDGVEEIHIVFALICMK